MMSNENTSTSMKTKTSAWQLTRLGLFASLAALSLVGCGGGASTTEHAPQSGGGSAANIIKPSADGDKLAFRDSLWVNINNSSNRCGLCHAPGKAASAYPFADINDLTGSYNTANQDKYINRTFPDQSPMVKKVIGGVVGHNCWLGNDPTNAAKCGSILSGWIKDWVQSSVPTGSNPLTTLAATQLTAPAGEIPVTDAITFPKNVPGTFTTLHTLLKNHCSNCHVPTATQAQQPYFAVTNAQAAYDAIVSNAKVNAVTPNQSRLFLRLATDHHNCWTSNCYDTTDPMNPTGDAQVMLDAIKTLLSDSNFTPATLETGILPSWSVNLYNDGITASSGPRVEDAQVAVYNFDEGTGSTVIHDSSTIGSHYDLNISGTNYTWLKSWGIHIAGSGVTIRGGDIADTTKLASFPNGYTIEAWVIPDNTTQEANIVGISADAAHRNVSLSQYQATYRNFTRQTGTTASPTEVLAGEPGFDSGTLLPSLQHVVVTYTPGSGRRVFINGVQTNNADTNRGTDFSNWLTSGASLVLGDEGGAGSSPWLGTIRKVAIHSRPLTANEVLENFSSGVGQKYILMFDVSDMIGAATKSSFIYMQAQEFDDYSYLFYKPTFIYLGDPATVPYGITIKGIHLGINAREATIGQAFAEVSKTINNTEYIHGTVQDAGQVLSYVGTVIPKDKGGADDQFFLTFEEIGSTKTSPANRYNPQLSGAQLDPLPPSPQLVSDVMIHTFEEINAGLAKVTGVNRTESTIGGTNGTYTNLYQQLPASEAIEGFLSSHQMGIAQLAIQYCSVLVNDSTKRSIYFPSVNFSGNTDFSNAAAQDAVINPLLVHLLNSDLSSPLTHSVSENPQPTATAVHSRLVTLINTLVANKGSTVNQPCSGTTCSATRTADIVKATCAAAYASAPMLLQ